MDTVKRELYFLVITWPKTMITQSNYAKNVEWKWGQQKSRVWVVYMHIFFVLYAVKKDSNIYYCLCFPFLWNAVYLCLSICLFTVQFKVMNVIFILQYFKIIPTVVHFVVQLILPVIFIVDFSLCVFCLDSTDDHDADL